ncbi:hypothetical protein H1R20_g371, partial [Candolleomyces eurysporus]
MLKALFPIALAVSASIPAFANPIVARAVPAGFSITSITSSGTGCPSGSVSYVLNAGGTAISILFSQFSAEVIPSIVGRNTSTCTLNFGVNIPTGYRFTLGAIDYRAFYRLDKGVKMIRRTTYSLTRSTGTASADYEVSGILEGYSAHPDVFDNAVPSRCGGPDTLNLVSRISIDGGISTNGPGRGYAAIDSMDSNAALDTRFLWEVC